MENGFVYIARRADGRIKIGASRNPKRRMLDLAHQTRQRIELIIAASCASPFAVERALLEMNAARLVEGREWFELTSDEVERSISHLGCLGDLTASLPERPDHNYPIRLSEEAQARLEEIAIELRSDRAKIGRAILLEALGLADPITLEIARLARAAAARRREAAI